MIGISDDTIRKARRHYLVEAAFFTSLLWAVTLASPPWDARLALGAIAIIAVRALMNYHRITQTMDERSLK